MLLTAPFLIFLGPSIVNLRDSLEPDRALYKDFGQEYVLARAIADGVDPYLPLRDLASHYLAPIGSVDRSFPTPHPPSVGLLVLPVSLLDYVTAVRVWFAIEVVCLVIGTALALRSAQLPIDWRLAPLVALVLVGWVPVSTDLVLGQLTIPMLAALTGAQIALLRGRGLVGGGLLGLAMLLKPLAWPWLLVLVFRRAWTAVGVVVGVMLLGYALPAMRVGFGPVLAYTLDVLPRVSTIYATEAANISLWTVGPRLFRGTNGETLGSALPVYAAPDAARIVGFTLPVLVVLLAVWWLRTRPPLTSALGLMTCLSILVNPLSWPYNLLLLILPTAQVVGWLHARRFPVPMTLAAILVGISLFVPDRSWSELGRLAIAPGAAADAKLPPLAGLITFAPGLATGALAILLVCLTPTSIPCTRINRDGLD